MKFGPLIFLLIFLTLLIGILVIRKASIEGKLILAFALLSIAAYFRLHFYLLLLTSLALFTFIGVAVLWAWIASARLKVVREVKKEALVGENIPVNYRVTNHSVLPLYHARVWDTISRERAGGEVEKLSFEEPGYVGFLRILRKEKTEGVLHFIPTVRGPAKIGPVAVEGGDPFGIFTITKWFPVAMECLVLPTWVRLSAIPTVAGRLGSREQEHLVSREGHSHEFLGIRPYVEGDSLRGVHWPLTAKHDTLIVRQFQREVEEEMLIILDADKCSDVGEGGENALEYLITLALSLVHASSEMGRPWNLVIVSDNTEVVSHRSREALLQAQYVLAGLKAGGDRQIETALADLRREYQNATCILLTARTDDALTQALSSWDSNVGDGLRSILIRVDPGSFVTTTREGLKAIKRRGEIPKVSGKAHHVSELTISRGDNIADLFPGRQHA